MTDKEKLIEYIESLTDDQIEEFISFLKTAPSSEEGEKPPLQSKPQPEKEAAV